MATKVKPQKNSKGMKHAPAPNPPRPGISTGTGDAPPVSDPHFGDPLPSADPAKFSDQRSDLAYYALVNKKLLQKVPPPRSPDKVTLTLEEALGKSGPARVQKIQDAKRIVFHSVGDTGPTKGPATVTLVADKMVEDFHEVDPANVPAFFYHLGDVVYSFGEDEYYFDQFYEPYRDYPAPIFAIPGNHDGVTYKGDPEDSLSAFWKHFCSDTWRKAPEAGGLSRTTMIQPGVYFTLDAPFVKIIGLYSNVLELQGVISSEGDAHSPVSDDQLAFLTSQLGQLKKDKYAGAVLLAVHHPPYSSGKIHGGSPRMLADLDKACQNAGFYPHAVLSGHAHNYQRYTRKQGNRETPYIVAGCGGHAITPMQTGKNAGPIRTPVVMGDLTFERYFAQFGYLRVVATPSLVSFEFHEFGSGTNTKSPVDVVTVDVAQRRLTTQRP
jgi:hypothetical protein